MCMPKGEEVSLLFQSNQLSHQNNFLNFNRTMNRIIKLEEEDYLLSSPEHDHAFFNHCLTTFYDQDSQEIIQTRCSANQVLHYLEQSIDICDTPLAEIMRLVVQNDNFKGVDTDLVRFKIIKQKSLLKRNRAKNRKILPKRQIIQLVESCDKVDQYKKQRNRISAQISRDKKKEKVKALEELNLQLHQQCERQKLENQRLKQELLKNEQKQIQGGQLKNKMTKLLVLLGIIFLFGIIKDIFSSNSTTGSLTLPKMNQMKTTSFEIKNNPFYNEEAQLQKGKVLNSIEDALTQVVESKSIVARIKQKIATGMGDWGMNPNFLTKRAKQEIEALKKQALQ